MNKNVSLLFAILFITGCAQNPTSTSLQQNFTDKQPLIYHKQTSRILTTDVKYLWTQDFDHYQEGLLKQVADDIKLLASQGDLSAKDLEKLTYYLRIYSSLGPDKDWQKGAALSVNEALLAVQKMPGFYQISPKTARLHENYAVALYRLYFLKPLQTVVADQIAPLSRLIKLYAENDLSNNLAAEYALWELLRAASLLAYEAKRSDSEDYVNAVIKNNTLQETLISFLTAKNAVLNGDDWPKQHVLWALANFYNLYSQQYWNVYYDLAKEEQNKLDQDVTSLPVEQTMDDLDNAIWQAINFDKNQSALQIKTLFSIPYVVSTFRGKSECNEGTLTDRCIAVTIEQALPIKHNCSESLFILAQKMTALQLSESCQKLISQEDVFHQKLATNKQPTPNDFNDKLRVVVFENAAEYNKYGQLVFDINTNNGGMYIEGTTQDPDNQATFYSYEHFWLRPEFAVWNLNHEYVHYLDGRFVKYDTFNHFPSHLVWWSEGLAEYISKGDVNDKAFTMMVETKQSDWLSLKNIFATKYNDGQDQVYKWGYLAVRYLFENHQQNYRQLAHYLKTDFFEGYEKLLDQIANENEQQFIAWLSQHKVHFTVSEDKKDPQKPRQFYRYSYKDYLQPKHLVEDKDHMVWQYWHANTLKIKKKSISLAK